MTVVMLVAVCTAMAQRHVPPLITPDRSGMANLGGLVLPPDVPGPYNTTIDPFNSRAYTGARRSPALVTVNIRGSLPTVVQEAVPTAMPPDVPSLTMRLVDVSDGDPRKHYIYATEHGNQ